MFCDTSTKPERLKLRRPEASKGEKDPGGFRTNVRRGYTNHEFNPEQGVDAFFRFMIPLAKASNTLIHGVPYFDCLLSTSFPGE